MFASRSSVVWWQRIAMSIMSILSLTFVLTACSIPGLEGGGGASTTPTPKATSQPTQQIALSQLHWCDKPVIIFRDEGAPVTATPTPGSTPTMTATPGTTTPRTLTDWTQIQPNLGFNVYLPATLPSTACLVSTIGTIHDSILGGSFVITYLLADHSSISLSEAPLRTQSLTLQCSLSSTQPGSTTGSGSGTPGPTPNATRLPTQLCTGARDTTNIVFSAQGDTAILEHFFTTLQSNVNWIPAA